MARDEINIEPAKCSTRYGEAQFAGEIKVKFVFKLINFTSAVIALSWFFEGWRQVNAQLTIGHALLLSIGTFLTLVFLAIHSYWAYIEEKSKGTLRKHIGIFEKIQASGLGLACERNLAYDVSSKRDQKRRSRQFD